MKRVQHGFGVVEMLISLVIGLVLLLGVSTILISMKRTADLRMRMAEVQGGQRMALTFIGNGVRYAGSFPYTTATTPAILFPAASGFGVGQSILGNGDNADADTVSVRFVASTSSTASQGCSANLVQGHTYLNVFSLDSGYLICEQTDTTAGGAAVTVKLIEGPIGMNVLYGVDSDGGGFVSQYLHAGEVATANLWNSVKAVRLTLTFANPLAKEKGQENKPTVSVTQTIPHAIGL